MPVLAVDVKFEKEVNKVTKQDDKVQEELKKIQYLKETGQYKKHLKN